MEIIETKNNIVLNTEQEIAFDLILNWLKTDGIEYKLSGKAGTGKTTLIKELIKKSGLSTKQIIATAPTHQAKNIIGEDIQIQTETIQKILGLRPDTDATNFNPEKPIFDLKSIPLIYDYKLVIIDEASQIGRKLYNYTIREASKFKTKILFVGDINQLPPIKEEISSALKEDENFYELKTSMRQKEDNPVINLLNVLISDIENKTSNFYNYIKDNPASFNQKGEGYLFTKSMKDFLDIFEHNIAISDNPIYDNKLTTYYNNAVTIWNKKIRHIINQNNEDFPISTKPLIKGDILVAYRTINNEFNENILINSSYYEVLEIKESLSQHKINGYYVTLLDIRKKVNTIIFLVKDIQSFLAKDFEFKNKAKRTGGMAWKNYYSFRNKHLVMADIYDDTNSNFKPEKLINKDFDFGYSITVHKAQGSTYENIYVDMKNIMLNYDKIERLKMLNTAISRCKSKAIIYY